jgi:hypothetical protein
MRDFFDKLVAGGEQAVAELITQKFQENVELEFKTKANPNGGETIARIWELRFPRRAIRWVGF